MNATQLTAGRADMSKRTFILKRSKTPTAVSPNHARRRRRRAVQKAPIEPPSPPPAFCPTSAPKGHDADDASSQVAPGLPYHGLRMATPPTLAAGPATCVIADRFAIESLAGAGGMGAVYRATDA